MGNTTTSEPTVLLQALKRSGLVDEDTLKQSAQLAQQGQSPRAIAMALINAGQVSPWQAKQLLQGYHALTMGNYKLLELLFKGAQRCRFLAKHEKLGREVYLTLLTPEGGKDERLAEAFLADARAAASLDHRNLAHVFDVDQDGERLFVVTEKIEGSSLSELVANDGPLSDLEAASLIRQAVAGLDHAHRQNVVHANLHPDNLIVDSDGVLKLVDIGFRSVALADRLEDAEKFISTNERDTPAGDMYAVGGLLHFALTGKAADGGPSDEVDREMRKVIQVLRQPKGRPDAARVGKHLSKWIDAQVAAAPENAFAIEVEGSERSGSGPVAPVAAGGEFAIAAAPRHGAKRKSKGAKPAKSTKAPKKPDASAPAPTASSAQSTPSAASGGANKWLLIGVAVAMVLLLGVGGLLAMQFMGGGDSQEVAQVDNTEDAPPSDPVDDPTEANPVDPTASNPADPTASNPEPKQATPSKSNAAPNTESNPEPTNSISSQKPAVDGDGAGGAENVENTSTDEPSNTPPADDTNTDPAEPSVPGSPEPNVKASGSEPDSADPEANDPKANDPKANDPKAAGPKPQPKQPPEDQPVAEPFADFPDAVELPELGGSKPLGTVRLGAKQLCFIKIRGGRDTLLRSPVEFDVKSGTDLRAWSVIMSSPNESTKVIAKLTHANDTLTFAWTSDAEAAADQVAGLKNCLLSASVAGAESHLCALRTVVKQEPFALKLEGNSVQRWPVESLPDPRRVKLTIAKVDGLQNYSLDPEGPLVINKGAAVLKIGAPGGEQMVQIQLTTATKGATNIEIKAAPMLVINCSVPDIKVKQRLNPKGIGRAVKEVEKLGQGLQLELQRLQVVKKQSGGKRDAGLDQRLSLAQQGVDNLKKLFDDMKVLEQLASTNEEGLAVHFQLTSTAGLSELDLMHAGVIAPAANANKAAKAGKAKAKKPAAKQ